MESGAVIMRERECLSATLRAELLPSLRGRVFHVTTAEAFPKIQAHGFIGTNKDGSLRAPRYRGYFAAQDCVSFCDLRGSDAEISDGLEKYNFLNPNHGDAPVFLFLREECYGKLIVWSDELRAASMEHMIVWHIESGYPGAVPLSCIEDEALAVTVHSSW